MVLDDVVEQINPDGLPFAVVGPWAEEKHRLLAHYATLFVRSMRGKWDELVYLDLFSGPGECNVRDTTRFYRSSPTIVYRLDDSFDTYIFCDSEAECAKALRVRLDRSGLARKFFVLHGDVNSLTSEVLSLVPHGTPNRRVLSFCFLDPFRLANLRFETIRKLSARYLDFLVLIPSGMDAHRNVHIYTQETNSILDEFLGSKGWRSRWIIQSGQGVPFERFVVSEFGRSMTELGYLDPTLENVAPIRSQEKNLLLYRLALYSRHELGTRFWKETRKYTNRQIGWDF